MRNGFRLRVLTLSNERVYHHLCQQGVAVTQAQVQQAAEQSGWQRLRQTLVERYDLNDTALRLRDEWLVAQLTAQVQALLAQMEANQALPQEQRLAINDLLTLSTAAGAPPPTPHKALPWLLRAAKSICWPCRCIPGAIRPTAAPVQLWGAPA